MTVLEGVPGKLKVIRDYQGKWWVQNDTTNMMHAGPFDTELQAQRIVGTYPERMRPEDTSRKKRLADYMKEYRARDAVTLDKARKRLEAYRTSIIVRLAVLDKKQERERETLASKQRQERDRLRREWKDRLAALKHEVKRREEQIK